jgi:hypothetical protein
LVAEGLSCMIKGAEEREGIWKAFEYARKLL